MPPLKSCLFVRLSMVVVGVYRRSRESMDSCRNIRIAQVTLPLASTSTWLRKYNTRLLYFRNLDDFGGWRSVIEWT